MGCSNFDFMLSCQHIHFDELCNIESEISKSLLFQFRQFPTVFSVFNGICFMEFLDKPVNCIVVWNRSAYQTLVSKLILHFGSVSPSQNTFSTRKSHFSIKRSTAFLKTISSTVMITICMVRCTCNNSNSTRITTNHRQYSNSSNPVYSDFPNALYLSFTMINVCKRWIVILKIILLSVSYTHLDVYKRQI